MNDQSSPFGSGEQPAVTPTSDERTMAILSHILTIAVGFLAPLFIYLIKKDESVFIAEHSRESLNFQITVTIVMLALFFSIIGILLIWAVALADLIFVIIATINASDNKYYRYPVNIRFIK